MERCVAALGRLARGQGPAGGRAGTGHDEPRSGREQGPGATPAREQIGKILRKIRIFSSPRGETCRKIKRDRGNPPGLSRGMVAGVGGHGFRGTFPPLHFTPGYSAPPNLPGDGEAAFLTQLFYCRISPLGAPKGSLAPKNSCLIRFPNGCGHNHNYSRWKNACYKYN